MEERCLLATLMVLNTSDSGPGSLRQAIIAANTLPGPDSIEFDIPVADANFVTAAGSDCDTTNNGIPDASPCWWRITLASPLPALADNGTEILGRTQPEDTNPGVVGTVINLGVDGVPLPQKVRPEIAIDGNGFDVLTVSGDATGIVIDGLAVYGGMSGIVVNGTTPHPVATIRNMLIGVLPNGADPGLADRNIQFGVLVSSPAEVAITNSYVGFNGWSGINGARDESALHVVFNEVFQNGWNSNDHDGIDIDGIDSDVRFNYSHDNTNNMGMPGAASGHGIELGGQIAGTGNTEVENNTVSGNISSGIAVRSGSSGNTLRRNVVMGNTVGISVNRETAGSTINNVITENRILDNIRRAGLGGLGIDLHGGVSAAAYDDVTINDPNDADAGSNNLANFPIVSDARIVGSNLVLSGFAEPGTVIEFFIADMDPTGFGEGATFLLSRAEGSVHDTDTGTGIYGPVFNSAAGPLTVSSAPIDARRFQFSVSHASLPAAIQDGIELTATGTLNGNTSEFAPVVSVRGAGSLSGFVYNDRDNDGVREPAAGENGIPGVVIRLESTDTGALVDQTMATGADGAYSFSDLRAGSYRITQVTQEGVAGPLESFLDGRDTIGTQGGSAGDDVLFNITLNAGQIATGNNFGELTPASLSGFVFVDLDNDGNRDGSESGVKDVTIRLLGVDDLGRVVSRTTVTNNNGRYSFDSLRPGGYEITEIQPMGLADGLDSLGSQGGVQNNDRFSAIILVPGVQGTDNNFGELQQLPALTARHTINLFPDTNQRVEIRVLSTRDFDPRDIDSDTVRLGNARVTKFRRGGDANGDGRRDVSFFFLARETGVQPGDRTVRLIGQFKNGQFFAMDLDVQVRQFTDVRIGRRTRM